MHRHSQTKKFVCLKPLKFWFEWQRAEHPCLFLLSHHLVGVAIFCLIKGVSQFSWVAEIKLLENSKWNKELLINLSREKCLSFYQSSIDYLVILSNQCLKFFFLHLIWSNILSHLQCKAFLFFLLNLCSLKILHSLKDFYIFVLTADEKKALNLGVKAAFVSYFIRIRVNRLFSAQLHVLLKLVIINDLVV